MSVKLPLAALTVFIIIATLLLITAVSFGQLSTGEVGVVEPAQGKVSADHQAQQAIQAEQHLQQSRPQPVSELSSASEPRTVDESIKSPAVHTSVSIDFEEEVLDDRIVFIEKRLTETRSRVDSLLMALELQVLKVQKGTLTHRRELENLRAEFTEQRRLTDQGMRNKERLVALVERYGAGDWVARHIKVEIEKFRQRGRRDVAQFGGEESLSQRLREYRQALFELGTRLFLVDSEARDYARALAAEGQPSPELISRLDGFLEDRKEALRVQEGILNELAEHATRLGELKHRRKDQLESLYTLVLGRMLWLKNREPLGLFPVNWALLGQAADGASSLVQRVYVWVQLEWNTAKARFTAASWPWAVAAFLFGVLPVFAAGVRRALRVKLAGYVAKDQNTSLCFTMTMQALRAAVWPFYMVLIVLGLSEFDLLQSDSLGQGLAGALRVTALILWVGLFGKAAFGREGDGERGLELNYKAARMLRVGTVLGCVAAFVTLVPRQMLLSAPGDDVSADLALARVLMITFVLIVLMLVAVVCNRRGSAMPAVLYHSRLNEGFVWSVWPLVHLLAISVLAGIIILNVAGYQYASQFVWQRIVGTGLLVIGAFLISLYVKHVVRLLWNKAEDSPVSKRRGGLLRAAVDLPLFILAAGVLLEVWGLSVVEFLGTPAGAVLLSRMTLIALVILGGIALVRFSKATVLSLLRSKILDRVRSRDAGRRLQTLAPLVHTSVKLLVVLAGALLILQLVGVETGPLLAGVGIFGLAVGFAAQSLIKDIINGLFMLTEGSVDAGDVVDVGGVCGVVEKVTLRSVRIRDLSGNVHFVPNSTIEHVVNLTKDYSRYLMDVGVGYREDTDEVVAIMKQVDEYMRKDPRFRGDMLEPIEIMGVDRFEDSAVIIRARLKTRPSLQWVIGREYNRRLKKAFDEQGIEIPFPHRTVYWGETKQGQLPLQVETRRDEGAKKTVAPDTLERGEGEILGEK